LLQENGFSTIAFIPFDGAHDLPLKIIEAAYDFVAKTANDIVLTNQ